MDREPVAPSAPLGLEAALAGLRRRYGAAVVRHGGDPVAAAAWPAGVPALDALLPGGGLPCGRLSVLAGEPAPGRGAGAAGPTGRLTLLQALTAAASREAQVAYLDLAGSLDPGFLADLGADLGACLVVRPPAGSMAAGLAMARALVRAGVPWLAVGLGRERPRGVGAALEHALTALVGTVEGARAVACVAAPMPLPAPLAYASSLTVACRSLGWQEAHGDVIGLRVGLRVVKSKLAAPGNEAALLLRYPRPQAAAEVVGLPVVAPAAVALPEGAAGSAPPLPAAVAGAAGSG
ncbi:MAG TPA: hypothetical protein VI316_06090 [Candidatus Dormibacteraeota bacterium]